MDALHAYRVFVAVVEAGSFSAAARNLGLAQPTVSKQVAALEVHLDTALLVRTTRRLTITAAGEQFYEAARSILDSVEQAEASLRRLDREPRGVVRVNMPLVFGQECVVPIVGDFLRSHPKVTLDLRFSDRFVDLLEQGVDLVIRVGAGHDDTSLVARKLGVTRRAVVGSPSYFARRGVPTRPHDLAAHECLAYVGDRRGVRWNFMRNQERIIIDIDARVTGDNGRALRQLATQGLGVAILATWLVGPDVQAGRLQQVLVDYQIPLMNVVALYPSRRFLAHRTRRFIDFLQARLAGHPYLDG